MGSSAEIAKQVGSSLVFAVPIALGVALVTALLSRVLRIIFRPRVERFVKQDLRVGAIVGVIVFVLLMVGFMLLERVFQNSCGTSHVTEAYSPDRQHKVAVYAVDCGATTDYSLVVSFLSGVEALPKHGGPRLYEHYHQLPVADGPEQNFGVLWHDNRHVSVQVQGLDVEPKTDEVDGVQVRIEALP